jgi:adenylosuccinate lyase
VPAEAAAAQRAHASVDIQRSHETERDVKEDAIAFTTAVAERIAGMG